MICQGQLHGMLLLWTGGAHVSSMPYALIFYDLQLILAPMRVPPVSAPDPQLASPDQALLLLADEPRAPALPA